MVQMWLEEWRPYPEHPSLQVSNLGRVCGIHGLRKLRKDKDGYPFINHTVRGKQVTLKLHRLVCLVWNGIPPFEGAYVLHRDDNKDNCAAANLYWGTQQQNMDDIGRLLLEACRRT